MQISTIGLDIAKNVFRFTGSTRPKRSSSGNGSDGARCWSFSKLAAVPDRHGSVCHGALLGARADEARPRGAPNAGEGCEGLRQAQQKRCG